MRLIADVPIRLQLGQRKLASVSLLCGIVVIGGDSTGIGSGDASNDGNWSRGHEISVCMVLKSESVCCCVPCERCVVMGTICAVIVVEFVVEFVV